MDVSVPSSPAQHAFFAEPTTEPLSCTISPWNGPQDEPTTGRRDARAMVPADVPLRSPTSKHLLVSLPPPMAHISRFPHPQRHTLSHNIATGFAAVVTGAFIRASTDDTGDAIVAALALHRSPAHQPHHCLQPPLPASSRPSDPLYTLAQRPRRAPICTSSLRLSDVAARAADCARCLALWNTCVGVFHSLSCGIVGES